MSKRKRDIFEENKLLLAVRHASEAVHMKMKLSPGGDLYTYQGGTSLVDALGDALEAFKAYVIDLSERDIDAVLGVGKSKDA